MCGSITCCVVHCGWPRICQGFTSQTHKALEMRSSGSFGLSSKQYYVNDICPPLKQICLQVDGEFLAIRHLICTAFTPTPAPSAPSPPHPTAPASDHRCTACASIPSLSAHASPFHLWDDSLSVFFPGLLGGLLASWLRQRFGSLSILFTRHDAMHMPPSGPSFMVSATGSVDVLYLSAQ